MYFLMLRSNTVGIEILAATSLNVIDYLIGRCIVYSGRS